MEMTQRGGPTRPGGASRPPLTRDRVVANARQLVRSKSVAEFSLRELATMCGVTPAALYMRVKGRDEVLDLVAEAEAGDLLAAIEREAGPSPTLHLRAQLQSTLAWCARHRSLLRHVMGDETARGDGAQRSRDLVGARVVDALSGTLARAAAEGELVVDEPRRAAAALWCAVVGIALVDAAPLGVDGRALDESAVGLMLAGMRGTTPRARGIVDLARRDYAGAERPRR